MLVLSRKSSQQIVIGSEISITVIRIEGSQVRLGIQAPSDLKILREELDVIPDEGRGRGGRGRDPAPPRPEKSLAQSPTQSGGASPPPSSPPSSPPLWNARRPASPTANASRERRIFESMFFFDSLG
jgi:carbon storage regulator